MGSATRARGYLRGRFASVDGAARPRGALDIPVAPACRGAVNAERRPVGSYPHSLNTVSPVCRNLPVVPDRVPAFLVATLGVCALAAGTTLGPVGVAPAGAATHTTVLRRFRVALPATHGYRARLRANSDGAVAIAVERRRPFGRPGRFVSTYRARGKVTDREIDADLPGFGEVRPNSSAIRLPRR